jgi:hypothetical protein
MIGPGGIIWLIDFATTREGHPLMDFAHLEAEIIAHIIASQITDAQEYLELLENLNEREHDFLSENDPFNTGHLPLLHTIHRIAFTCLANPSQPREYWLALFISCLGALKYRNLNSTQKYFLFLTAAFLSENFV